MPRKITPEKIEEVKQAIAEYEYRKNGMHRLNGADVIIRNIRMRKDKAVADIVLIFEDRQERYNDLDYDFKILGVDLE